MIRVSAMALALSFCLAGITPATAGTDAEQDNVTLSPQEFPQFRAAVDRELRAGGNLAGMKNRDRRELASVLERMGTTLAKVEDVEDLNYRHRVDLFNDQERLQNLLDQGRKESRLVCERRRSVGTHVTRVECLTVAERERRMNASQNTWRVVTNRGLNCQGGGGPTDFNGDCKPDLESDL